MNNNIIHNDNDFQVEYETDYTLWGEQLERIINATVPDWFIRWFKKDGCNCNLRKDLLNNWNLDYREYKQAVRDNEIEQEYLRQTNYDTAINKLDSLITKVHKTSDKNTKLN